MKIVQPVNLNKNKILIIYKQILNYLNEFVYKQILDNYKEIYNINPIQNSISSELKQYIKKGLIVYDEKTHLLKGQFNSRITKELKKKGYLYTKKGFIVNVLDNDIVNIINENKRKNTEFIYKTNDYLNDFVNNINSSVDLIEDINFNEVIQDYDKQIIKNFNKFNIKPDLLENKDNINNDYVETLKYDIKGWLQKDIEDFRNGLLEKEYSGDNIKTITEYIQHNYNVNQNKAMFLARNECKLLLSNYTKSTYQKNGFDKYKWLCAMDERTTNYPYNNDTGENHKVLHNKIFSFSNPPIMNQLTGRRGNPGDFYNCYSKDTELLTKKGFKLIKDVEIGEEVATINPQTKQFEWGICNNKIKQYKDYIYNLYNNIFDLSVSENHTFFYYKYRWNDKKKDYDKNKEYPVFTTGIKTLSKKNTHFLATCNKYIGNTPKTICNIPTEIFCQFMGFYLSDGNVDKRTNNCIHIAQQNNQWMFDILKEYLHIDKGKEKLFIYNRDLFNIVAPLGYCNEKYIPEIIKTLESKYIRIFLDAFSRCDGTYKRQHTLGYCYNSYYTTSKQMMADLVECIYKTNMSCSVYTKKQKDKEIQFKNGIYKLNYDLYIIQEMKTINRNMEKGKIDKLLYNDYVYDIEVNKNHTLLIKYGKSIHWNSNCRCVASVIID